MVAPRQDFGHLQQHSSQIHFVLFSRSFRALSWVMLAKLANSAKRRFSSSGCLMGFSCKYIFDASALFRMKFAPPSKHVVSRPGPMPPRGTTSPARCGSWSCRRSSRTWRRTAQSCCSPRAARSRRRELAGVEGFEFRTPSRPYIMAAQRHRTRCLHSGLHHAKEEHSERTTRGAAPRAGTGPSATRPPRRSASLSGAARATRSSSWPCAARPRTSGREFSRSQ